MFFKRESVERGSVKTDREPSKFNLYCAASRSIYAWAVGGIYPQTYLLVTGRSGTADRQKLANNALRELR